MAVHWKAEENWTRNLRETLQWFGGKRTLDFWGSVERQKGKQECIQHGQTSFCHFARAPRIPFSISLAPLTLDCLCLSSKQTPN